MKVYRSSRRGSRCLRVSSCLQKKSNTFSAAGTAVNSKTRIFLFRPNGLHCSKGEPDFSVCLSGRVSAFD